MGKARGERDWQDRREMVENIRRNRCAMSAQANVSSVIHACPVRFTFHASRLTVS